MKVKSKKPRCKYVVAIVGNRIQEFELLREETYPPRGDFDITPFTVAVVRHFGAGSDDEIMIPISTVMFLKT
jgi:hypothetical protein